MDDIYLPKYEQPPFAIDRPPPKGSFSPAGPSGACTPVTEQIFFLVKKMT
jgi:hypothetical protein